MVEDSIFLRSQQAERMVQLIITLFARNGKSFTRRGSDNRQLHQYAQKGRVNAGMG